MLFKTKEIILNSKGQEIIKFVKDPLINSALASISSIVTRAAGLVC